MSLKRIGLSSLVGLLCGLGVVHAQAPAPPIGSSEVMPLYTPNGTDGLAPYPASAPSANSSDAMGGAAGSAELDGGTPLPQQRVILGLPSSPWLVYPRSPCCCGPVGGHCGGPLGYEVFARSGVAFPVGGGIFGNFLHPGWDIEGGGRLLLFNPAVTKAWTISLSVSNIFNRTGNDNRPFELFNVPVHTTITSTATNQPGAIQATTPVIANVPRVVATVSSLNQTFVNVGFGREWYLLGSADPGQQNGCNWRVGADAGGRYGTAMVQFNELNHHTDVIGGVYCAIHTDVEIPFRCGIFQAGVRYEYNYIWTSLLQNQNNADYQSMNLLFQLGVRF